MEKYCTAGQATEENLVHVHYMLETYGYEHGLRICNTVFPLQQWLQKCASALHYTYTACLVAIKVDSLILTLAYYPLQYSSPC